jgi:hypothetical protein
MGIVVIAVARNQSGRRQTLWQRYAHSPPTGLVLVMMFSSPAAKRDAFRRYHTDHQQK